MKIIECVPNFSEGSDETVLNSIETVITSVDGITVLDIDPGKDTNRTVVTFVGEPDKVINAAFKAIKTASKLIDMTKHRGAHPRMGATDVCPLIPIKNVTMKECVEYSHILAEKVAKELDIPVYMYENSATNKDRENLSNVRSGEFEAMKDKIRKKDWKPDYGPTIMSNNAGVTAIGAREFLLAYNINLNTVDKKSASHIALNVREAGRAKRDNKGKIIRDKEGVMIKVPGTLKSTKAVGWYLEEYGIAQVSMNLTNYNITSLHEAFEEVRREANDIGLRVTGSEVVGLLPLEPVLAAGKYYLKKQNSSRAVSDKEIIHIAIKSLGLSEISNFNPDNKIIDYILDSENEKLSSLSVSGFIDEVSSNSPAPGGGSVSALSGSLGASLAAMVSNLTYNKKGYEKNNSAILEVGVKAQGLKKELIGLIDEDSNAFNQIMKAYQLKKKTDQDIKNRNKQILMATKYAIEVPLTIMKKSNEMLNLMDNLIKYGNKNSLSDGAVSLELLMASIKGAHYNVKINLKDVQDMKYSSSIANTAESLLLSSSNIYKKILKLVDREL